MSVRNLNIKIQLPVTEARVLRLTQSASIPRTMSVRHLNETGDTGPATVKWQESQDGVTFTDIAGTATVLNPGAGQSYLITSTSPFVALSGFGDVAIEVAVQRTDNDSPSEPQFAI
ncbi:hypothetical protein LCGC14_0583910 [marine sediment metagenome]|uniref:BIG2 domain-containing protein n=1 Tax=marine sediment metagenome TaxID=412755 RepID=A0A0F9RFM6_9ZZZZ